MEKGPVHRSLFCHGASVTFHHAVGFSGAKISLSFLAGSLFENEDEYGLAHLLEHLVFKETKTKRIEYLEKFGADLNAYTYKETICFELECHSGNLEKVFPFFMDHFTSLDFTNEQFEKEKKIILHELKEDEDDHEVQGVEEVFEKNFPKNLGHPVGGTSKEVRRLEPRDVKRYFKKYFRAERMILTIVSGKKQTNSFREIIEDKIFSVFGSGRLVNKEPVRLNATKLSKKLNHFTKKKIKKMESSISFFSFNGPKINDSDYYSYLILDDILFEGLSSLFFKKLREEKPLVYGMGSSINSFHHCGLYMMVFRGSSKTSNAIKNAVDEVLEHIADDGISSESIQMIKNRMYQNWEVGFDSLEERLEFLTDQEVYGMSSKTLGQMRRELELVSVESVKKVVHKIYKKNKYSYLLYKKKDK